MVVWFKPTINIMTKQEIFDKVAKHLIKQNCKSLDDITGCCYRGVNNTMCAVGCLIKDEFYNESLENKTVRNTYVKEALKFSGIDVEDDSIIGMLIELQDTHDCNDVKYWRDHLTDCAKFRGLLYNID